MLINNVVYVDGKAVASPASLDETYEVAHAHNGMAWIGLYRPDAAEVRSVAEEFGLHHLAVEDAIAAHQRPKAERYGTTLFTVLRPARYIEETEEVEFGELHVFTGVDFVVTIRHAETPDLAKVRRRLEHAPDLLTHGPEGVLYAILDQVVSPERSSSFSVRPILSLRSSTDSLRASTNTTWNSSSSATCATSWTTRSGSWNGPTRSEQCWRTP